MGALMKMGVMANATQSLDGDTAELVVSELGHKSIRVTDDDLLKDIEKTKEQGCINLTKKFDKYDGEIIVTKEKIEEKWHP